MALFAEISGAESLGELGAGAENDFQVRNITRSKSAGAESCSEVRAQNANIAQNLQNLCFIFFQKRFLSSENFWTPKMVP